MFKFYTLVAGDNIRNEDSHIFEFLSKTLEFPKVTGSLTPIDVDNQNKHLHLSKRQQVGNRVLNFRIRADNMCIKDRKPIRGNKKLEAIVLISLSDAYQGWCDFDGWY